jgi:hypothetical protein
VVLCRSRQEAEAALAEIREWTTKNGLRLHPDKTQVGDCRQPGEGFDFLGYRFEAGRRWVRKKSLARLKDGIRAKTKRTRGASLARIVADLNPLLRGWFGYFKHAHPYTFEAIDGLVRRRLRAPAQAGEAARLRALPGRPETLDQRLLRGSRAVRPTHGLACRATLPMRKPPTGEPYAGHRRCSEAKTARAVRRAGRAPALPDPYHVVPLPRPCRACRAGAIGLIHKL